MRQSALEWKVYKEIHKKQTGESLDKFKTKDEYIDSKLNFEDIQTAKEMGAKSFYDGKMSIPIKDKVFVEWLKSKENFLGGLYKAWSKGWHRENLKV